MGNIQAFIASDHESTGERARQILLFNGMDCLPSHVMPLDRAAQHLSQARPGLIILILSPAPDRALSVLDKLRGQVQARVVVVGPGTSKLVLRALRAGASDYVDEVELEAELQAALLEKSEHVEAGRTIAVLAPSGGSGSSTLAANVASALAREHKNVALVDLKLASGDLAALLDLKPTYTLADLGQNLARMDRGLFERSLVQHASGVHLLAPPRTFEDIAYVTPESVRQALTLAREVFPYVVVDLDRGFHDVQVQALRQADVILLVLRLDFAALRNARRTLDHLGHLGIDRERVRLVVNRYGQPKELPAAKAEEALGLKIFHLVPDDPKAVNRANNNGVPFVLESPSARVSRSVARLAVSVNGKHKKP
jgi:pilus assembly protein CpaE